MQEHKEARQIVDTLNKEGFLAYYAGGWVRDLLLKHESDDIDIATNAPPETIQALFPHTVPIGISFGIILVIIDDKKYEVATFRKDQDYLDGRRPSKVEFTNAIEDAKRRDFTINGMFYDPIHGEILDYVEGQKDLNAKLIRAIGNPFDRFQEDKLRMVRAARLACRFNFVIEEKTKEAILKQSTLLFPAVAIERVWQEITKAHAFGKLKEFLIKLDDLKLLKEIFPTLKSVSHHSLTEKLSRIDHFPKQAPLIAFILALFPEFSFQDELQFCQNFKRSNAELKFITLLNVLKILLKTPDTTNYAWAYFYAEKDAYLCLEVLSANMDKADAFLKEHDEKILALQPFIQKIQDKDMVIKSEDLKKCGIAPGPLMGKLLERGNEIAINDSILDTNAVLKRLKGDPLWPDSFS